VPLQARGNRRPLHCVHPSGGGVLCYLDLVRSLPADQPVYGLQAAVLAGEQLAPATVPEMAARYVQAVREVQPTGPYRLAGWSMGGSVAYEMAHQLQAGGETVELLALIDSRVVPEDERQVELDESRLLAGLALEMGLQLDGLGSDWEEVAGMGLDAQLALLLGHAQRLGLLPPDLDVPQARQLFEVFRANGLAVRAYRPPAYAGRLVLFRAQEWLGPAADPALGWADLAAGGVELREIPGNHFTILKPPHVQALAAGLAAALAAGDPDGRGEGRQAP
jgi:thioesterase domain-containing protein